MSLNRALVDSGRKYGKARTGRKVEGTTQYVDTGPGSQFRCRLTLPGTPKNTGVGGEPANSVNVAATLMTGIRDRDGNPLAFSAGDELRIDSPQLGIDRWMVWQDPEPIRKRKKLLGWQMALRRFSQVDIQPERRIEKVRAVTDRVSVTDEAGRVRVRP